MSAARISVTLPVATLGRLDDLAAASRASRSWTLARLLESAMETAPTVLSVPAAAARQQNRELVA